MPMSGADRGWSSSVAPQLTVGKRVRTSVGRLVPRMRWGLRVVLSILIAWHQATIRLLQPR